MAKAEYTLKLLIDSKANKVLFAEAGKDFVDFLFFLLDLPLKTLKFLMENDPQSWFGKLYESILNFDEDYLLSDKKKDKMIYNLIRLAPGTDTPLVFHGKFLPSLSKKLYTCSSDYYCPRTYVAEVSGTKCPSCNGLMINEVLLVGPKYGENSRESGYVKNLVQYIVADDLCVKPMTLELSLNFLKSAKDSNATEFRVVKFGPEEGIKLLRASLETNDVLTKVFIQGKRIKHERNP